MAVRRVQGAAAPAAAAAARAARAGQVLGAGQDYIIQVQEHQHQADCLAT